MNKNTVGEILAPVGNFDMLYAAVRSGADAVYLGAEDFNARRNAQNFSLEDLKEAVKYCHIRSVKVYLTLNILVSDNEFNKAVELCFYAYNAGVDAVIIADTGLALYISKVLPELALHASTQMTVYSPEALPPLKEMGFTRVVAAREMSKNALINLVNGAKELNMEVEVFVHGALCMCVSGQCLMSAFLGGRSGNRGLCAGPCRLPFSALDKKERYDLSLKDLSLLSHIKELCEMGVASFKIEGRMKRSEYVAAATTAVKYAKENGNLPSDINDLLKGVFSRSGFTDGYYTNNLGKDMFGTRTKDDVLSAPAVLPKLHELYRKEYSHIPLNATLTLKQNCQSVLTLSCGEHTVSVMGEISEKAVNKPLDKDTAFRQLSKLGNTPYLLQNLDFYTENGLTLPSSALNSMRRNATEQLNDLRSSPEHNKQTVYPKAKTPTKKEIKGFILRVNDISLIPNDISFVKAVCIPAEKITKESLNLNIPVIAELPRVCEDTALIKNILFSLKENGVEYVSIGNLSQIELVNEAQLKIIFGFGMNIFSSFSCDFANSFYANGILLSPELTVNQINNISCNTKTAVFVYGKLPLMIFKNCPIKNAKDCNECKQNSYLTDRKNEQFGIRCRLGFSELFNSTPIWMADRLNELNCDYGVLYFTNETKQEITNVLNDFKNGNPANSKFTRGLYNKGVL